MRKRTKGVSLSSAVLLALVVATPQSSAAVKTFSGCRAISYDYKTVRDPAGVIRVSHGRTIYGWRITHVLVKCLLDNGTWVVEQDE